MNSELLDTISGSPEDVIEIRSVMMQRPKCPGYISAEFRHSGRVLGTIVTDEGEIRYLQQILKEHQIRVSSVNLAGTMKTSSKIRF